MKARYLEDLSFPELMHNKFYDFLTSERVGIASSMKFIAIPGQL